MADYTIVDEPTPGSWSAYAVRPVWILIGLMLAGAWFAFPWFIFNAHALGTPTKARETGVAVGYFGVAVTLAAAVGLAMAYGLSPAAARYLLLSVLVIKLTMAVFIVVLQSRTFAVFESLGGELQNPLVILVAGVLARAAILPEPTSIVRLVILAVLG